MESEGVVWRAERADELFTKHVYGFTGKSDLATYMSSATAGHYRSAYRHINKWWRAQQATQRA